MEAIKNHEVEVLCYQHTKYIHNVLALLFLLKNDHPNSVLTTDFIMRMVI